MTDLEAFKAAAAAAALALVRPGMRLGLGTGSTARHFVAQLGALFSTGALPGILCVPTSEATRAQAEALGLPLSTLDALDRLDLTIDGADEFDPALALIKGGGGALLREKIVAAAADRMVVIADSGKKVARLGAYPLPVEILPFGRKVTERAVARVLAGEGISGECHLRLKDGAPLLTDNGNVILDCHCGAIADPARLAAALEAVPGVMAQGLFIGLCQGAFVAGPEGVEQIGRTS